MAHITEPCCAVVVLYPSVHFGRAVVAPQPGNPPCICCPCDDHSGVTLLCSTVSISCRRTPWHPLCSCPALAPTGAQLLHGVPWRLGRATRPPSNSSKPKCDRSTPNKLLTLHYDCFSRDVVLRLLAERALPYSGLSCPALGYILVAVLFLVDIVVLSSDSRRQRRRGHRRQWRPCA